MMWLRDYDLSNKKKWYRGEYSSSGMLIKHFRRLFLFSNDFIIKDHNPMDTHPIVLFFLLVFIVSCVLNTSYFIIKILRGVIKNE